jgi:hypothetical protein
MLDVQRSRVADLDQQLDADDQDKALQTDQAWRTGLVKATLAENQ